MSTSRRRSATGQIAQYLGLPASDPQEGVISLIEAVRQLMQDLDIPDTIAQCGWCPGL